MAMYLGSFSQGLFGGAQSAFQLYSMYQGIRSQQEGIEALDKADKLRAEQEQIDAVPGSNPTVTQNASGGTTVIKSSGSGSADEKQPATSTPAPTSAPAPGVNTQRVANTGFGTAIGGRKALDKTPGTGAQAAPGYYPPQPNESGPMYPFEGQMPNPSADYGPAIPTPQPPPPVTSPPPGPSRTPGLGGVPPAALQFMPQAGPPAPPAPAPRTDATAPVGGYFGANGPYPQQRPPIRQPGGPYQPPPQQMPARPPPPHEPYGPETPPGYDSVAAAPVTQPTGGYLGPNGPYPQQPPPQQRPGGGPVILPQDPLRYTPPVVPQQQPGGGAGGTGGTPLAQAEPSVGGRILGVVGNALSAINPIGSAHAETMSPEQMYGGVGLRQPAGPPPPPGQLTPDQARRLQYDTGAQEPGISAPAASAPAAPASAGLPAAPAAAPAAQAPAGPYQPYSGVTPAPAPTGITPAQPPASAPGQTPPAPVAVPGQAGQVAPSQQGPSVQSEYTPVVTAPPVSPRYWEHFAKTNPELAARIEANVAKYGGNAVSKYDVAAIIYRESRGDPNAQARGAMGNGQGLMQIEPGTQSQFNEGGRLKPFNPDDNIAMGVKYLKYLALDQGLGTGSTQMHLAYMRGMGGVAEARTLGWQSYAERNPIAGKGVSMLYDDKVPIQTGMFTGGGGRMNAPGVVQAAESGPDGLLSYMAESGPPGMGMSDRWRQVQSLLEHSAIRSGKGVEALGPIQDWVAQQAHQGAVSNLLAAYQSMSSGNGVGAASALAKAHAFFPDDTYGRFGVDKKGQVWAEQFSEVTGESMGKPFQITKDMLAQQVLALQHPHNFIEVLQKYQSGNADIDLKKAHAKYYSEMPEIQKQNAELKAQTALEVAGVRTEAQRLIQENKQNYDAAKAALHESNTQAIDKDVDKYYGPDVTAPSGVKAEDWAAESEVFRSLRMPHSQGGANLGAPTAKSYAQGLREGTLKIARGTGPNGKEVDVIHRGSDPKNAVTSVTPEQGNQLRVLLGIPAIAGSKPIAPPASGQQRATGPVGAGLGSQAALSSGYNTFTGLPTRPMQQQATV